MQTERQMPQYQSHKKVWALKIAEVVTNERDNSGTPPGAMLVPVDEGYAPFPVSSEYMQKHEPKAGGYYVVYQDGYKSFSPADAFEDGYTRI